MIEYKSDGLVVFVTSVGGGGSGEGGGSGGQMHPASLEKLVTREDELEAENSRLRGLLQQWEKCCFVNFIDDTITVVDVEKVYMETRAALKEKE